MVAQKFNLKSKCVMSWMIFDDFNFLPSLSQPALSTGYQRRGSRSVQAQVRHRAVLKSLPYAFHQVHRAFKEDQRRQAKSISKTAMANANGK